MPLNVCKQREIDIIYLDGYVFSHLVNQSIEEVNILLAMKGSNITKLDTDLIDAGRKAYYHCSILKSELVETLRPMLENIVGEHVIYQHRYALSRGKILRIKKDIVVIEDSYYRRRIQIKNIMIFHPSIVALLQVLNA